MKGSFSGFERINKVFMAESRTKRIIVRLREI